MLRIEIDGEPAAPELLARGLLANYGHFTAMQVRDGRAKGLELHLRRLDEGNRELYGEGLAGDRVRELVSRALGEVRDAAVRVIVFGPDEPSVLVSVAPPAEPSDVPQRLMPVDYTRPLPHVKHLGGFGQLHHRRRALRAGFDDALLVSRDGVVVEGSAANLGFVDADGGVVWPQADWLHGTAMALLERELPSRREVVRLEEVGRYRAAFLANSRGVAPVSRVGDVGFAVDEGVTARLRAAYDAVPGDEFR
ncbi:aminotransferase class IV [Saccharothrix xinjiangensis]|uniref:Aminotransferase class IV n=1 Tax=Saccharothrix xinjiangensis TaxID=204798 RepID=A0ABV9XRS5_9PSEU